MPDEGEGLLRELYAGLEVLKSQQTEIIRRLGNAESSIERVVSVVRRVESLEESSTSKSGWITWVLQTIGYVLLVSLVVSLGQSIGMELKW